MDRLLEATARAERDHFWFKGLRAFVEPALRRAGAGPIRLVLDCGCGTGANLAMLRKLGPAVGVDLTWRGLQFAREHGERQIAQASAAALPFADASVDVVVSFDMLQCLPVPAARAALAEMRRVLRPGGHLVLNVAAMNILWGNHSVLAHEVHRYGRRELRDLLQEAGFEPLRVTYTNATLFPILAPLRIVQRALGVAASDEDAKAEREIAVPAAPVNAAMTALLWLEAAALRVTNMPFGSSLLALARAPEPIFVAATRITAELSEGIHKGAARSSGDISDRGLARLFSR
jgi:SAM-dependent methyltransferase